MADKPKENKVSIIDPNNFNKQYHLNDNALYNMSVPTEDLCIIVELKTNTKSRTILDTTKDVNSKVSAKGSTVSFIDGTNNGTTGNENYLTTQYTELSTERASFEETLGITSVEIEFNSSYAPMVTINFIDIKGGAIFQTGGESKYNVFFRLPYPLFELKIKGYYGKPVTYCLHMTKCATKFNSQTGNFEITANFVGYTYAMLADMNIGYLKAAAETEKGAALLKARGVISINEFILQMADIDNLIKTLLSNSNQTANDSAVIIELKDIILHMEELAKTLILNINEDKDNKITSGNDPSLIVMVKPITTNLNNNQKTTDFNTALNLTITEYNDKLKNFSNPNILTLPIVNGTEYYISLNLKYARWINDPSVATTYDNPPDKDTAQSTILKAYPQLNKNNIDDMVSGVQSTTQNLNLYLQDDVFVIGFNDYFSKLNDIKTILNTESEKINNKLAEELKNLIKSALKFDPTIRNIINILTTHVEIFLEQLADVSKQYKNTSRLAALSPFVNNNNSNRQGIDVKDIIKKSGTIYPWPEYHQNNIEQYLGSLTKSPVKKPLDVPEIDFVEKLFTAMITSQKKQEAITAAGTVSWYAFNPVDSKYYGKIKPYDRLDVNAKPQDIVRLATLRAVGFMGFSNKLLTEAEIVAFATSEAQLIINKYDIANTILPALKASYPTPDDYAKVVGTTANVRVINEENSVSPTSNWKYVYNSSGRNYFQLLPVNSNFNDDINTIGSSFNELSSGVILSPVVNNLPSDAAYIDIITANEYNDGISSTPTTNPESIFNYIKLNAKLTTSVNMSEAGFSANNGKYGVQDFNQIDYAGSPYGVGQLPFYSLFYDNTEDPSIIKPGLCKQRKDTTFYDVTPLPTDNINVVNSTPGITKNIKIIYTNRYRMGQNLLLFNDTDSYYSFFDFKVGNNSMPIDLFGSRFYNQQNIDGKAFLFLHAFPWRKGLTGGIFTQDSILNVFKNRTGIIQVPKLFPAFIGGLLLRYQLGNTPAAPQLIYFKNRNNKFILPNEVKNFPKNDEYMNTGFYPLEFKNNAAYTKIDQILLELPEIVKNKFIDEFNSFVIEYDSLRNNFDIIPTDMQGTVNPDYDLDYNDKLRDDEWVKSFDSLYAVTNNNNKNAPYIKEKFITQNFNNLNKETIQNKYNVITFYNPTVDDFSYNFICEYKDNSLAEKTLKSLFRSYKYIINDSWMIWDKDYKTINKSLSNVLVPKADFTKYMTTLINALTTKVNNDAKKFFDNNNNEQIKLEIYRNLKKIYDKWLGNIEKTDDILFQCCALNKGTNDKKGTRLDIDKKFADKRGDTVTRLIDSFRFVSRSFKDIGDDFQINPVSVTKLLLESSNLSFYDVVGRILTDNHFEFIALPNFINYNDPEELKSVFTPYPYYMIDDEARTGPSFVCVYIGQSSTKLDFGDAGQYPDDGFNFTGDEDRPEDFNGSKADNEDAIVAFIVRYGQQNQNIFKDINLDQSEFNETAESVQITDQIANRFSQTNQTYVGQNLYDVYSVRSYKVDIEMMGNAMIQPMMYFQLDNIPMFRGAYLITKVKHSIAPNTMSTTFSGVRINRNQTPLLDTATIYSSILQGADLPTTSTSIVPFAPRPANPNIVIINPSVDDIAFYKAILTGIGAPDSAENLKLMYAWRQGEGATAAFNPFNTTWAKKLKTTAYNCSKGVALVVNYASKQDGINATINTLKLSYYDKIRNGLIKNLGAYTISTYIDEFRLWGTGKNVNDALAGKKLEPPAISSVSTGKISC